MQSLGVGNARTYQEAHSHCQKTGAKIIKSRFVFTDKVDVDEQHIVRARLVTKDFASNQPSALDLGIASQTASVEAFKAFLCRVVQDTLVLWGLDVSTAFLYAKLVLDTVFELPGCFQNLDGSKVGRSPTCRIVLSSFAQIEGGFAPRWFNSFFKPSLLLSPSLLSSFGSRLLNLPVFLWESFHVFTTSVSTSAC